MPSKSYSSDCLAEWLDVVENRIDWFLIVAGVCRLMLDAPFCKRHEPERADGRKAAACFLPWHKSTRRPHERDIIVKMHNTKDCLDLVQ